MIRKTIHINYSGFINGKIKEINRWETEEEVPDKTIEQINEEGRIRQIESTEEFKFLDNMINEMDIPYISKSAKEYLRECSKHIKLNKK